MRTYKEKQKTIYCNAGFNFSTLNYDELSKSDKITLSRLLTPSQIKEVIRRLSDDTCLFVIHNNIEFARSK